MKTLLFVSLFALLCPPLHAQTIDDGIMMTKQSLFTGGLYSRETWDEYWEGPLKRNNGNIGRITTQARIWSANYGVTDRLNVIGAVPFVFTEASQGVLHGIRGFQDLTVAAKYNFYDKPAANHGAVRAIAAVAVALPLTNYNIELPPLSIGSGSKRLSGRFTIHFQSNSGWFVTGSSAYTDRARVTLDRPYFYTNDEFVMSDKVEMPNTLDYTASTGFMKRTGLMAAVMVSQQYTLGGGDIRRQDMPFASNRMNVSKVGAMLMYPIPKLTTLGLQLAYAYTLDGRNVGKATSFTAGLLYRYSVFGRPTQ